jgi:hypothetical protein
MRIKGRWILLAALLVAAGYLTWSLLRGGRSETAAVVGDERVERIVPDSLRIKVEVLNATNIRGLARRGTFVMRDLGFDVVNSGNSAEKLDSTTVIVRNGRMEWGELAARGLGGARVIARPDTSRYLDLTILLGTSWRPPAQTFHP